jgi:hypothetical protein
VVHVYKIPALGRLRQNHNFEAILEYIVIPCLTKKEGTKDREREREKEGRREEREEEGRKEKR